MSSNTFTRLSLANRPTSFIDSSTFALETHNLSDLVPTSTHAVIRVDYISLDPAMRGWLNDRPSYVPPVQIGEVMRATGLGTVEKVHEGSKFKVGDVVRGQMGWREYGLLKESDLEKINVQPGMEILDFLGPLSYPGMTAYFGLSDVAHIQAGETLVVSGAAGAVGSVACQIGKLKGARVFAIAGTAEKCAWLKSDLGVDEAFNYKDDDFYEKCGKALDAVGGLDVFFDNVGGKILDFMLTKLKKGARVALCGSISQYNSSKPEGITNYLNLIVMRAKVEGFIVFDYAPKFTEAEREMARWIAERKLISKFHVEEGLAKAPEAVNLLYTGGNTGKLPFVAFEAMEPERDLLLKLGINLCEDEKFDLWKDCLLQKIS